MQERTMSLSGCLSRKQSWSLREVLFGMNPPERTFCPSQMISIFKITFFQSYPQKMHHLILSFFGIICRCCPVAMTNIIDISWFRNVNPSKESMSADFEVWAFLNECPSTTSCWPQHSLRRGIHSLGRVIPRCRSGGPKCPSWWGHTLYPLSSLKGAGRK